MRMRLSAKQENERKFLCELIKKYNYEENDYNELRRIYSSIIRVASPYAIYKINHMVMNVNDIDDNQTAVVAMTLGREVDELQKEFINAENEYELGMFNNISNELLIKLYAEFNEEYTKFHRRYVRKYIFIGGEIPVERTNAILAGIKEDDKKVKRANNISINTTDKKQDRKKILFEDKMLFNDADNDVIIPNQKKEYGVCEINSADNEENNVEINSDEYGNLTPSKSVVFYAVLSDNPKAVCYEKNIDYNYMNDEIRLVRVGTDVGKFAANDRDDNNKFLYEGIIGFVDDKKNI